MLVQVIQKNTKMVLIVVVEAGKEDKFSLQHTYDAIENDR